MIQNFTKKQLKDAVCVTLIFIGAPLLAYVQLGPEGLETYFTTASTLYVILFVILVGSRIIKGRSK